MVTAFQYVLTLFAFGGALALIGYSSGHKDGYKTGYGNGKRAGQFTTKSVRQ